MPDCVACPSVPACDCRQDQECVLVGRSCTSCGENICQDKPGASHGHKSVSAGATAGPAVGGAIAGLVVALLAYSFWRKRRRQHLQRRLHGLQAGRHQSSASASKVRFGNDAKTDSAPAPTRNNRMSRQMAMNLEEKGLSPREEHQDPIATSPSLLADPSIPTADNPFSDNQSIDLPKEGRTSLASQPLGAPANASRASTLSSPSTAYIPAHASSLSVTDGQDRNSLGSRRSQASSQTIPELRLSLGPLPQADAIAVDGGATSPGQTTPGSSAGAGSPANKPKIKPVRPTREGLDLRLPTVSSPATSPSSTFGVSPPTSPGFPWSAAGARPGIAPPNTSTTSRFSGYTDDRSSLAPPSSRPVSSSSTAADRSHMSTMSYILNPPQIVTATSMSRVEVAGHAFARTVQLGSSYPTTSGSIEKLSSTVVPSPDPSRLSVDRRTTMSSFTSEDPFADEVSAVINQFPNPLATPTFGSMSSTPAASGPQTPIGRQPSPLRQSSISAEEDDTAHRSRANTPISVAFSANHSARGSMQSEDSFSTSRPNTMFSSGEGRPMSKDSLMDSMPFKQPPMPSSTSANTLPASNRQTRATLSSLAHDDTAPLPEPNKPFAGAMVDRHSTTSSLGALEGIPFNLGFAGNDRGSMWSDASDGGGGRDSTYNSRTFSMSSNAPPVPSMDLSQHMRTGSEARPRSVARPSSVATDAPRQSLGPSHLKETSAAVDDEEDVEQGQELEVKQDESAERLKTPSMAQSLQTQQHKPTLAAPAPKNSQRASVDSLMQSAMLAQQFQDTT